MSVPAVLPFKTAVHIQSTGMLFLLQVPFSSPCVVIYSGKYLWSLPCLAESLVIKAAGQVKISSIISYYRKELQSVFLGGRDPRKCTFQSFLVTLVWALRVSSMRDIIYVFVCLNLFFSVFSGGFGKRTRRRATPSSSPKRRWSQQMAWNQAQRTSSRSEPGQLLATVASAEDLSLKPAPCVSPFNYCQSTSLQWLPARRQWIDTLQRALSLSCSLPLSGLVPWLKEHQARHVCMLGRLTHLCLLPRLTWWGRRWSTRSWGSRNSWHSLHRKILCSWELLELNGCCCHATEWRRRVRGQEEGEDETSFALLKAVCSQCWALLSICRGKSLFLLEWCPFVRGRA